jgi:hypothetical protein
MPSFHFSIVSLLFLFKDCRKFYNYELFMGFNKGDFGLYLGDVEELIKKKL